MAVASWGRMSRTSNHPLRLCTGHARRCSSAAAAALHEGIEADTDPNSSDFCSHHKTKDNERRGWPVWRKMGSKEMGIKSSMIAKPAWLVLNRLRDKGHAVYLVGGCVRDLIMKRTPKDFDIITSADLRQVQKIFAQCYIIGKRFPICHVHVNDSIIEVSSFHTSARKPCKGLTYISERPSKCSNNDYVRWMNCLGRDFTINGLMFNPHSNLVYDYTGGMEDIKKSKVRTVIPAFTSFQEDCARILRGIRIAARLGFQFARETAVSLTELARLILRLDRDRLFMEMNYMLSYGSGQASLRLLWKFGLLELLLPIQAAYFVSQGFQRRDNRFNMLLALFSNLDKLLAPNRPCHSSLWVGLLAFHQALLCDPRDPLVVATFALTLHNGGNLLEAINIAITIKHIHDSSFPELLQPQGLNEVEDIPTEVLSLLASVRLALAHMTDRDFVSQAMEKYPQAPFSNLVFIPLQVQQHACRIFDCVDYRGKSSFLMSKQTINYLSLCQGGLEDLRHVFARVVFDTVYPPRTVLQKKRECPD